MKKLASKKQKASQKSRAYAWVAYMMPRHPEEFRKMLKYGTPSDELILLSDKKVEISIKGKKARFISFPASLHKSAGQKLIYKAAQDISEYKKSIPVLAHKTYQEFVSEVKLRRADATENLHIVAEAVFYRAAVEFKAEVLFSFDSINMWIKTKYGKTLGYQTIRKALELLESKFYITVREWGQKNNRRRCTKIFVNLSKQPADACIFQTDDWIMEGFAAFKAVESRESTARQDVLEVHIQRYIDQVVEETDEPAWPLLPRLFPATDDKILVEAEKPTFNGIEIREGLWDDEYIDRLLGSLVSTVQEDEPYHRQSSTTISKSRSG